MERAIQEAQPRKDAGHVNFPKDSLHMGKHETLEIPHGNRMSLIPSHQRKENPHTQMP